MQRTKPPLCNSAHVDPMLPPPWRLRTSDWPSWVATDPAELETRVPSILPGSWYCLWLTLCPVMDWDSSLRSFLASCHLYCINFTISMDWIHSNWTISIVLFCPFSLQGIIRWWLRALHVESGRPRFPPQFGPLLIWRRVSNFIFPSLSFCLFKIGIVTYTQQKG